MKVKESCGTHSEDKLCLKKQEQEIVLAETMLLLPWIIHRIHCEPFSLELLSPEEM